MTWKLVGAAAVALAVAACGTEQPERATGAAAAGAVGGAGVGALFGPIGALAGGALGAGAGFVTGATTSPSTLNLGGPPWNHPDVRPPLNDSGRGMAARREPGGEGQAAWSPGDERDRAYMGGGMVDTRTGTSTTTAPARTGGTAAAGTGVRPMPMATTNQPR